MARRQLLGCGLSGDAIKHRVTSGRLHRVERGVYAVGRPELTRRGRWMAAVLSCGPGAGLGCGGGAVLSHESAAALWGIEDRERIIAVTLASPGQSRRRDRIVHRTHLGEDDIAAHDGIPTTTPVRTLIDLATIVTPDRLEAAVNAADKLDLIDPESLRVEISERTGQRGVRPLRQLLDRRTFALTESALERRFLRLARNAGLPRPETGVRLNGFRVDFLWRDLDLVVETDGLRYHRTAAQQARDRRRDQAQTAAGLTTLRFTYAQVAHEPDLVAATLTAVAQRLAATPM